MVIIGMPIA